MFLNRFDLILVLIAIYVISYLLSRLFGLIETMIKYLVVPMILFFALAMFLGEDYSNKIQPGMDKIESMLEKSCIYNLSIDSLYNYYMHGKSICTTDYL